MRRTVMMLFVIIVLIGTTAFAQQNIGGVWRETSTKDIKNSIVIISQDGNDLTLCSSWEYRGSQIVWHGNGKIDGRKVVYQIKHTKNPDGWGVEGTHELELSSNGKSLSGKWKNSKGETGSLKFEKVR